MGFQLSTGLFISKHPIQTVMFHGKRISTLHEYVPVFQHYLCLTDGSTGDTLASKPSPYLVPFMYPMVSFLLLLKDLFDFQLYGYGYAHASAGVPRGHWILWSCSPRQRGKLTSGPLPEHSMILSSELSPAGFLTHQEPTPCLPPFAFLLVLPHRIRTQSSLQSRHFLVLSLALSLLSFWSSVN